MTAEYRKLVEERRAVCAACPEKNPVGICNQCGCVIFLKTMLRSAECPTGRWSTQLKQQD